RGEIDEPTYQAGIERLIRDAISWQEAKGLDVLVHGEFERTDMVEYFGERMDGFHTTRNGWVLSYGSRCVRPPILAAPPSISEPITVREWQIAQSASAKPVKGMLTVPVTIVNWSFRPRGVPDDQMHTQMGYGDFGEIVPLWADAGVDVASIEFSRSKDDSYIRQFYELFGDGHLQIGPGVFDVHSPDTPGTKVMEDRLDHFRVFMADGDLWVNPDCGLKTR